MNGNGGSLPVKTVDDYKYLGIHELERKQQSLADAAEKFWDWVLETLRMLCWNDEGIQCTFETRLGADQFELQLVGIRSGGEEKILAKLHASLWQAVYPLIVVDIYYGNAYDLLVWFGGGEGVTNHGQIFVNGCQAAGSPVDMGADGLVWSGELMCKGVWHQTFFMMSENIEFRSANVLRHPAIVTFLKDGLAWFGKWSNGVARREYEDAMRAPMRPTGNGGVFIRDWYKLVRSPPADWTKQRTRRENGGAPLQVRLC
jgi:hypothetical protein